MYTDIEWYYSKISGGELGRDGYFNTILSLSINISSNKNLLHWEYEIFKSFDSVLIMSMRDLFMRLSTDVSSNCVFLMNIFYFLFQVGNHYKPLFIQSFW